MKKIVISDATLCRERGGFSFKEKIEIARQLSRLQVDVIELPAIASAKTDVLLVRTVASFAREPVLSVGVGMDPESLELAAAALSTAAHPRLRVELSLSPVGMEYTYHKKPDKMLARIPEIVGAARKTGIEVEFCALDATRAEEAFLQQALAAAVQAGATVLSVSDAAGQMMPDDFAGFAGRVAEAAGLPVTVQCGNCSGLACAAAALALRRPGVCGVRTSVGGTGVPLGIFADMMRNCGGHYQLADGIRHTELHRIVRQIEWIAAHSGRDRAALPDAGDIPAQAVCLDAKDGREDVMAAVRALGYDLSEEDSARVYEEFQHVAAKKQVGARDLEAIVASTALQVPPTYRLKTYVVNSGNVITASAQITLTKGETELSGVCIGEGPVEAAVRALEQIIGRHYELDDFQIHSVTEGTGAVGSALVRLRSGGRLYSGNGVSTDIIGAGIRAYINAVNKIVYEEDAQ